jgi:hypothetical protein
LKLNCDEPLSNVAFIFTLRRYIQDSGAKARGLIKSNKSLRATVPGNAQTVTEVELVALIAPYYARSDLTRDHKRKQLLTDVIRPLYGRAVLVDCINTRGESACAVSA